MFCWHTVSGLASGIAYGTSSQQVPTERRTPVDGHTPLSFGRRSLRKYRFPRPQSNWRRLFRHGIDFPLEETYRFIFLLRTRKSPYIFSRWIKKAHPLKKKKKRPHRVFPRFRNQPG